VHTLTTALMQAPTLDATSAVSIGLVVTIVGATAYLSRVLTRTEEQLKSINEKLSSLADIPRRLAIVENHIGNLEGDINNLWAAYREDSPHRMRRERGAQHRNKGESP
jgi:hypothetical protein